MKNEEGKKKNPQLKITLQSDSLKTRTKLRLPLALELCSIPPPPSVKAGWYPRTFPVEFQALCQVKQGHSPGGRMLGHRNAVNSGGFLPVLLACVNCYQQ